MLFLSSKRTIDSHSFQYQGIFTAVTMLSCRFQFLVFLLLPTIALAAFCSRRGWASSSANRAVSLSSPYSQPSKRATNEWIVRASKSSRDEDSDNKNGATSPSSSNNITTTNSSTLTTATTKSNDPAGALALQQQAAALRAEVASLEIKLRASKEAKRQKELADIDRWIEECLYVQVAPMRRNAIAGSSSKDDEDETSTSRSSSTTTVTATRVELLNSVEKAAEVLRDRRYSHEQVSKMFERICDTSPAQSRSNCSPLLALLVDAAGKLDCVERVDNPNKRWDGRVERDLRKRLFAMDWNIQLELPQDNNDRFV